MKVYQGRTKSITGLGIAIAVLTSIVLGVLILVGINGITTAVTLVIISIICFLYKGMIIKITVDEEKIVIYKPLGKSTIKFSNIAFCMVHGIDENKSIIYAFVKKMMGKKTGVKGVKQDLSFEEIVRIINRSNENINLDINFNMAKKIPVSFVENSEELKEEILTTLGGYQKRIINNI